MLAGLLRRLIRAGVRCVPGGTIAAEQAILAARKFSPDTVLQATSSGFFPMANSAGRIEWRNPKRRAVIPVDGFRVPKSLRRLMRTQRFEIRLNSAVDRVITCCADRENSWITPEIADVYAELSGMGVVRTVEAWQNGQLVGGVYGLAIGRYFVSESQFHRVNHAGKVCFATLFEILCANGFLIHDVQYSSGFLQQFGAIELSRDEFRSRLTRSLAQPARFELPSTILERVATRDSTAHADASTNSTAAES
jgi:leucyl/phenylalanyl-tRNA--protein transferase